MRRRSFLGGLSAAVAGLFGCGKAAPAEVDRVVSLEEAIRECKRSDWMALPETTYDPTVADRDKKGKCLSRIYRLAKDGQYYEIGRDQPKPGDRCIVLGLDGRRLWSAEAFTVGGPRGSFYFDGEPVVEIADTPAPANLFRDGL